LHGGHIRFRAGDSSSADRAVTAMVSFLFTPLCQCINEAMNSAGRRDLDMLVKNMDCWKNMAKGKLIEPDGSQPAPM